ncbi:hypothetical protein OUZ56_000649 [Daphnia magna]|uniref:Uncharacterized protein n=1 Tax=Daphnia magna TaxID=35525 RepID=A0ABR0A0B1_9CRUS|nr:hypothetical protein OUZ56_000649 [Daphnia magna]
MSVAHLGGLVDSPVEDTCAQSSGLRQPIGSSNHMVRFDCVVCWNKLLCGGEASIWDVICQLLVEMAKEQGLDQHFIPHSSLEFWCAHSCSGTFSSVQVTNNIIVRVRESCTTMKPESLA